MDPVERRLIPAYAGKTRGDRLRSAPSPAHPRVCGENSHRSYCRSRAEGSSPRMRGKRYVMTWPHFATWLIPAYAGKTRRSASRLRQPGGSSPRMRGKQLGLRRGEVACRLIPAYAGKTTVRQDSAHARRAHPRVCGENSIPIDRQLISQGSSPRMRGKLQNVS